MRHYKTREVLAGSFREVAAQKNANKITVHDIVANCGLSPATFYRHFRDKYDLIAWMYGEKCAEIFHQFDSVPHRRGEIPLTWVNYCDENRALLRNLLLNTSGHDAFLTCMIQQHVRLMEDRVLTVSGEAALTDRARRMIYLHASGVVRLLFAWLEGTVTATAEEIADTIHETVPSSIVPLITPPGDPGPVS